MNDPRTQEIVAMIQKRFHTFGGEECSPPAPNPVIFSEGVNVEDVVNAILDYTRV
jgi:hypothetical protein